MATALLAINKMRQLNLRASVELEEPPNLAEMEYDSQESSDESFRSDDSELEERNRRKSVMQRLKANHAIQ